MKKPVKVRYSDASAIEQAGRAIAPYLEQKPVIMCIGTDKSTGDSLGPIVGSKLKEINFPYAVYGSLSHPVHAGNLEEAKKEVAERHPGAKVIAIDACLGNPKDIGFIKVKKEPLLPGQGVRKNLGEVGDVSIIGIVNTGGYLEFLVLQNTRLYLVMSMADVIVRSLQWAHQHKKEVKSTCQIHATKGLRYTNALDAVSW